MLQNRISRFAFFAFLVFVGFESYAQKTSKKDYLLSLSTEFGEMKIVLYDETPLHKANFINLTKKKFYKDLLFHRIIENFMIQGGDPNSRNAQPKDRLGMGGGDMERIPFEFKPNRIHKKGALAAASDGNSEKKSNPCQFYIVQGKKWNDMELDNFQRRNNIAYTSKQRELYKTLGGTAQLDNRYTVFGEVVAGLVVLDSIAKQPKDQFDRPLKDIKMNITVKKMSKKKITKQYGYRFE